MATKEALKQLLESYLLLANSGDAGDWNPDEEPVVIQAKQAIAQKTYEVTGDEFAVFKVFFDSYKESVKEGIEAAKQVGREEEIPKMEAGLKMGFEILERIASQCEATA